MAFTERERQQAETYAINGAMFMFRAGEKLAKESSLDAITIQGMSKYMKMMIMTREWINIDSKMVIKYCNGTMDRKNKYIFDNGDIKVIPERWDSIKIS
jgi:hypothetical protein